MVLDTNHSSAPYQMFDLGQGTHLLSSSDFLFMTWRIYILSELVEEIIQTLVQLIQGACYKNNTALPCSESIH